MARSALIFVLATLGTGLLLLPAEATAETQVFGSGVSLEKATPIHAILADPDAYLGKTVRIEGGVLDVCPAKGCWIEIGDQDDKIQVKVEDDVIVFPADAKGRIAAAQGQVEAVEMSREQYVAWLAHLAEERGEELDEETTDLGDGPFRLIRIRGTGARIESP
jgi:hypothetical protein